MKKQNIEVEGDELLIMSDEGHYAVIPAKHRQEVMDMIKDGCDNCINSYIQTLPKDSDYAEDGNLLLNFGDPIIKKDNTNIVIPIKNLDNENFRLQNNLDVYKPKKEIIKQNKKTKYEKDLGNEYINKVLNPSITQQLAETLGKPLRWEANPLKAAGDLVSITLPNSPLADMLPNTDKDIIEYRKTQLNPFISKNEKWNNTFNEVRNLGTNALINVGSMELGFTLPKNLINPSLSKLFKIGSTANFAADLIQISKIDFDKVAEADLSEIGNMLLNIGGLYSKMDNFDASGIVNRIKNWKNISRTDKLDTYKDIFNLGQSINQQTQRQ